MRLSCPSYDILSYTGPEIVEIIEKAGRVCYKSEDKIGPGTAAKFVKMICNRNHESVLEHSSVTVKFICDRGISHELVRHRIASYSQESTRYCNYKGGVQFIIPPWCNALCSMFEVEIPRRGHIPAAILDALDAGERRWLEHMQRAEEDYLLLLEGGWTPQEARSVLPNSLKTEVVMTANMREWKHVFKLRCDKSAHPQMQQIMVPLHDKFKLIFPEIYDD